MTQVEALAKYAARASFADLSAESRRQLPIHILDSLGCCIAALGAGPVGGRKLRRRGRGGAKPQLARVGRLGGGSLHIVLPAGVRGGVCRERGEAQRAGQVRHIGPARGRRARLAPPARVFRRPERAAGSPVLEPAAGCRPRWLGEDPFRSARGGRGLLGSRRGAWGRAARIGRHAAHHRAAVGWELCVDCDGPH